MGFFSAITSKQSFAAFRFIDFRRFIFSKFTLTLAQQMQFIVLSWQVYEITRDPLSLGLIGLAEAIPAVGFALYGGHVADKVDRRKILIAVQAAVIFCSSILLFITLRYSGANILTTALPFYFVMFLIGIARGFYSPAQFSLMTQLIPRETYANSSAWNSTFWHIAVVIGSSAGGLLLGFLGKVSSYSIVIVFELIALIQIIRVVPKEFEKIGSHEKVMTSIKTGLRFVYHNKIILGALSLDLIAVLFGGAVAMLPVFAKEVLMVGEKGFGFLRAAPFAGAVIMALILTKYPPVINAGKKLLWCVACFSLCMIVFALSRNFYLSFFILALSGAFDNVSVVIRATILQLKTPENMRGRVSSVSTMFISSSNEIGAFESGVAAKLLGLIPSVIFGGGIALVSVFGAAAWIPSLRKLHLKHDE
jgi:MFS family permease